MPSPAQRAMPVVSPSVPSESPPPNSSSTPQLTRCPSAQLSAKRRLRQLTGATNRSARAQQCDSGLGEMLREAGGERVVAAEETLGERRQQPQHEGEREGEHGEAGPGARLRGGLAAAAAALRSRARAPRAPPGRS